MGVHPQLLRVTTKRNRLENCGALVNQASTTIITSHYKLGDLNSHSSIKDETLVLPYLPLT
jgi:hypothetical protein